MYPMRSPDDTAQSKGRRATRDGLCFQILAAQAKFVGLACVLQLASGEIGSAPVVGVTD